MSEYISQDAGEEDRRPAFVSSFVQRLAHHVEANDGAPFPGLAITGPSTANLDDDKQDT